MKIKFYSDVKVIIKTEDIQKKNIIYCLTFPNGKQYIGQTKQILEDRIKDHIYKSFNLKSETFNSHKSRAIRKYMEFTVDILYQGENLDNKEIEFIKQLDTFNKGYNSTKGGGGNTGRKMTKENKEILINLSKDRLTGKSGKDAIRSIEILQYNLDGIFIKEWSSIKEAANFIGISSPAIHKNLTGKSKT